jgi:hypothetical protein
MELRVRGAIQITALSWTSWSGLSFHWVTASPPEADGYGIQNN